MATEEEVGREEAREQVAGAEAKRKADAASEIIDEAESSSGWVISQVRGIFDRLTRVVSGYDGAKKNHRYIADWRK